MDEQNNSKTMIRYCYDYARYLMVVNKKVSKDYFLERSGIIGGYAKDMFVRLYDAIFSESEDLVKTYDGYYRQEFESFGDFLLKKYSVPTETIGEFIALLQNHAEYTLIRFDSVSYGENLEVLLSSGIFDSRLEKILLMEL